MMPATPKPALRSIALALLLVTTACRSDGTNDEGNADDTGTADDTAGTDDGGDTGGEEEELGQPRVRKLSNHELANTFDALLDFQPQSLAQIPPDQRTYVFDRMAAAQTVSQVHLDAFMAVAADVHETLLAEQRLDELTPACTDDILPPAVAEAHTRVAGAALLSEPDWASCPTNCLIGDPLTEDSVYLLYASPGEGAVSHMFEVPTDGRYRLTLRVQTELAMTTTLLADAAELDSFPVASDGSEPVALTTTQTLTAGSVDLRYEFSNNNEVIHILDLTIEGPIDEVDAPTERRACAEALVLNQAHRPARLPIGPLRRSRRKSRHLRTPPGLRLLGFASFPPFER